MSRSQSGTLVSNCQSMMSYKSGLSVLEGSSAQAAALTKHGLH